MAGNTQIALGAIEWQATWAPPPVEIAAIRLFVFQTRELSKQNDFGFTTDVVGAVGDAATGCQRQSDYPAIWKLYRGRYTWPQENDWPYGFKVHGILALHLGARSYEPYTIEGPGD